MKTISIIFEGYWRDIYKSSIPEKSGIYCVYRGMYNKINRESEKGTASLKELIYIGDTLNIRERISIHDRLDD